MGDRDRGIIGLLIVGVLYAFIKLGDEFIIVLDDIWRVFKENIIFRLSLDNIGQAIAEIEISIESIVLGLFAIFLVIAIVDYVTTEM